MRTQDCTNPIGNGTTLCDYVQQQCDQLVLMGRHRTRETYMTMMRSFLAFNGQDMALANIDEPTINRYEAYLRYERGVCRNTSSFYLRVFRTVYGKAVEDGLIENKLHFKRVYTGVDKTHKRAITLQDIKTIYNLDLSDSPKKAWARDLFMFSFYMRGMSFVDMAFLRKTNLHGDMLIYNRRKTGHLMCVKWEPPMQRIIDRYPLPHSPYLLPIIFPDDVDPRRQYLYRIRSINHHLRNLSFQAGISSTLTTYVARHSWASIARAKDFPLSIISEGLGHENEATTRIYLQSIESTQVDIANKEILGEL